MRLPLILDIDLDYFVHPIVRGRVDVQARPSCDDYTVRDFAGVRELLEKRCHLSSDVPICGAACEHHSEVFHHLDRLIDTGELTPPFNLIHIDAHDDISGYYGSPNITSANFLLHCIRRDWIDYLVMLLPDSERDQLPEYIIQYDPLRIEFETHRASLALPREQDFELPIVPDILFVTRSPDFTPPTADPVYDLIRSYVRA